MTDGERVYVRFGNVGLFAYDFAGNLAWSVPVASLPTHNGWGTALDQLVAHTRTM